VKRRAWLIGLAATAGVAGLAASLWRSSPKSLATQPASDQPSAGDLWTMRFERPAGGELVMAELRGSPLLLNFWATWCAPCIAEMPMLDGFQREHAARGWKVVGLAVDNPEPVREFVRSHQLGFAIGMVGFAGAELARELGNTAGALPFSVVFDRSGNALHKKLGAIKAEDLSTWLKAAA
jgi:thiol-disulfide isomerase/thioredoxin